MKKLNNILNIINLILIMILVVIFAIDSKLRLWEITLVIISIIYLYLILKTIYKIYIDDLNNYKLKNNWKGKGKKNGKKIKSRG